jgi:hypothetical protein
LPRRIADVVSAALFAIPGFARHLVMDRWFLHRSGRPLPASAALV